VILHLCCGLVFEVSNLAVGVEFEKRGRLAVKDYKETALGPAILNDDPPQKVMQIDLELCG
jgi:hypothetical protein